MGDDRIGQAFFADKIGQRARINAAHRNDVAGNQPVVEMQVTAIIGGLGDFGLEDRPDHPVSCILTKRLKVFAIGSDIADMREGKGNNLPGIGWIGENFLIAGNRCIETNLCLRHTFSACTLPFNYRTISQNENRRCDGFSPWASISGCIGGGFFCVKIRHQKSCWSYCRSNMRCIFFKR